MFGGIFPNQWSQPLPRRWKPVYYDAIIVRELADKYEPVSDHIETLSRATSGILAMFDSISIGCIKLIKREPMGTFLR